MRASSQTRLWVATSWPREAFEFIRYVNQREPMEKLCLRQRKFSPLAQTSPSFVERHPNPYIHVFIALAASPHARTTPQRSIWTEYRAELDLAADRAFTGLATPESALSAVRTRMQRKLDRELQRWEITGSQRQHAWEQTP